MHRSAEVLHVHFTTSGVVGGTNETKSMMGTLFIMKTS